jgi:hypothetical protein
MLTTPTSTIPAAAVTMRTSALTCIRSKAAPSHHNRYSRKPEPERHGRRPHYYWATKSHQSSRSPARLTAGAASSETQSSSLDLQRGALRHHPLLDKAPQGDGQFACESNDANLATSHPHPAKPLVPPQRKLAVGLVTEPEPSQLDQCLPSELCAIPRLRSVSPLLYGLGASPTNDATCRRVSNERW